MNSDTNDTLYFDYLNLNEISNRFYNNGVE